MTDSLTTGSVLEGSLSGGGGAQSTGRATAANGGARQQNNSIGGQFGLPSSNFASILLDLVNTWRLFSDRILDADG